MPTIKRFEELDVWRMARVQCEQYAQLVLSGSLHEQGALKDQMDRSSASVMDNIAEGFDRFSRADFRHFLVIARGSNAEFRSQLYRANDRNAISDEIFQSMKTASEHLGVKLHHFISYLSKTEFNSKPEARDLSAGSGAVNEALVTFTGISGYDLPVAFCAV